MRRKPRNLRRLRWFLRKSKQNSIFSNYPTARSLGVAPNSGFFILSFCRSVKEALPSGGKLNPKRNKGISPTAVGDRGRCPWILLTHKSFALWGARPRALPLEPATFPKRFGQNFCKREEPHVRNTLKNTFGLTDLGSDLHKNPSRDSFYLRKKERGI